MQIASKAYFRGFYHKIVQKGSVPNCTFLFTRNKRIGASECLERERGPGGPPSGMKWSAFA